MDSTDAWTGQAAPYGQACMQCFKAKCKCVVRETGDKCERCHRLGRQCAPSDSIRRRTTHRNSGNRFSQLEGRIDSLETRLQNATKPLSAAAAFRLEARHSQDTQKGHNQNTSAPHSFGSPQGNVNKNTTVPEAFSISLPSPGDNENREEVQVGFGCNGPTLLPPSTYGLTTDAELGMDIAIMEQNKCLEMFTSRLLPSFPFIHFPSDISVETLRKEKPFLLRAICTVATPSTATKLARGAKLKLLLSRELMAEGQSSMDLLFATLTFATWSYDQFLGKKSTSRFVMMAISLVYELRLNSAPEHNYSLIDQPGFNHDGDPRRDTARPAPPRDSRDDVLVRSRAVLGCYLLSACVASYYQHIEPLRWTSNLEDFLQLVEANKGCQNDITLARQIRLQLILDKLQEIDALQSASCAGTTLYLGALREQLRGIEDSIPPRLPEASALRSYCRFVELRICEVGSSAQSKEPSSCIPDFQRVDSLFQSFRALKHCFETWFSMPPSFWTGFPLIYAAQIARCLSTLFTFATYEDPGCNFQASQNSSEALEIVDRVIETCAFASQEVGETAEDDLWRQMGTKMAKFRACIVSITAPRSSSMHAVGSVDASITPPRPISQSMIFRVPAYGFYGTGEWMDRIFDGPFF